MENLFRRMKLSEIGQIVAGGTPKTKIEEYWNGDVSWITPKDLSSHASMYISKGERNISQKGLDNSSAKLLPKGTVLFTSRAPIGYVAIARNEVTTNQGFKSIIVDDENDNIFVYYLLKNNISLIENHANGSTFKEISGAVMKNLEFNIPSLMEQKSIAHILSTLDDKIEVNNKINKTLENMAHEISKQWFVDFEFPNEDGEPYKSSGGEMIESDLGLIPKGWEVGKFIDLIEITSGKRPGKRSDLAMEDCKYPLVGASSIMGYTDDFNFEEKILVIGRVGTHGVVQRFNNKVWASDNTLVIKSDNYEFAYQILNQIDYKAINRGSTQPLITQTDIKNYTLIIPTEGYLNKFELLVGSLFEIHSNHCIENSKLTEIRDSLLPKLMSGEIRVPMDEEGEAS